MKKTMILLTASVITAALLFTGCASSQASSLVSSAETSAVVSVDTSSAASAVSTTSAISMASKVSAASVASTASKTSSAASVASTAQKTFTVSELATYNGKNGNPAYIAVDGVVYDVTNVKEWKNGTHQDYAAGLDLTKEIKAAPHGVAQLDGVPVVGTLQS